MNPDLERELREILEESICPFCMMLFNDPILINTGQTFCRACIKKIKNSGGRCPITRAEITTNIDSIPRNFAFINQIDRIKKILSRPEVAAQISSSTTALKGFPYGLDTKAWGVIASKLSLQDLQRFGRTSKYFYTIAKQTKEFSRYQSPLSQSSPQPQLVPPTSSLPKGEPAPRPHYQSPSLPSEEFPAAAPVPAAATKLSSYQQESRNSSTHLQWHEQYIAENQKIAKVIIVGSKSCGKSKLLTRLAGTIELTSDKIPNVNYEPKLIQYKYHQIRLYDTPGYVSFTEKISSDFHGALCIIFCYDISNRLSLTEIPNSQWKCGNTFKFLVGTKSDLEGFRQVTSEEGANFAKRIGAGFIECSSITGANIKKLEKKIFQCCFPELRKPELAIPDLPKIRQATNFTDRLCYYGRWQPPSEKFPAASPAPVPTIKPRSFFSQQGQIGSSAFPPTQRSPSPPSCAARSTQCQPKQDAVSNLNFIKIVLFGNTNSGKSTLLARIIKGKYLPAETSTIGVGFGVKLNEAKQIKLQFWDTPGQEHFISIVSSYCKGASCCIINYNITERSSFLAIPIWINLIDSVCHTRPQLILVGNYADVEERRQVTNAEGTIYAMQIGADFFECSAMTGQNVNELEETIIRRCPLPPSAKKCIIM